MLKNILFVLLTLFISFQQIYVADSLSANGNSQAKIKVVQSISVTSTREMDFGEVSQSDWSGFISPWDAVRSANFFITGQPGKTISVSLPSDDDVKMVVSGGSLQNANDVIGLKLFNYAGSLTLSGGSTNIAVGATHNPISATQNYGDYSGSFTVVVIYNN